MESSSQPLNDASNQIVDNDEQHADPIGDFKKQLEGIINTYGSATNLMEEQISILEKDEEILEEEITCNNEASNTENETTVEMLFERLGKKYFRCKCTLGVVKRKKNDINTIY